MKTVFQNQFNSFPPFLPPNTPRFTTRKPPSNHPVHSSIGCPLTTRPFTGPRPTRSMALFCALAKPSLVPVCAGSSTSAVPMAVPAKGCRPVHVSPTDRDQNGCCFHVSQNKKSVLCVEISRCGFCFGRGGTTVPKISLGAKCLQEKQRSLQSLNKPSAWSQLAKHLNLIWFHSTQMIEPVDDHVTKGPFLA